MLFLNLSKLQSEELLKTFMNHKTQRKGTVFGIMVSDIMSADCMNPKAKKSQPQRKLVDNY